MEKLIDKLPHGQVMALLEQVQYEPGKVVSLTVAKTAHSGITLFAFDSGTALPTHDAPGDALVVLWEGSLEFTVEGQPHAMKAGDAIVLSTGAAHSLKALTKAKMSVFLIKP